MLFDKVSHYSLIVEYDGAYWHRGRERSDRQKAEMLSETGYFVVRVREEPLRPQRPEDVWVPKSADAFLCARLVLMHVAHMLKPDAIPRIEGFLAAAADPLEREQVPCRACWQLARRVRRLSGFPYGV